MLSTVIAGIGAAAGLFFAFALLARARSRTPEATYLAAALILLAFNLADDALISARAYDAVPDLFGFGYLPLAWIGPLIWLHVAAAANPVDAGSTRARPHLIGAAALTLVLIPWFAVTGDIRWRVELGIDISPAATAAVFSMFAYVALTVVQQTGYVVWAFGRARAVVDPGKRRWLRALLAAAVAAVFGYAATIIGMVVFGAPQALTVILNAALTLALYGVAAYAIVTPPDPATPPLQEREEKYARSGLTAEAAERLRTRLKTLARTDQIHRDPTLTLAKLARTANASVNDVSQVLNTHDDGFHAWLARERILDAQKLLKSDASMSLLDAAYAVGFNAKSTFYEAFRKFAGQTPAAWRAAAGAILED